MDFPANTLFRATVHGIQDGGVRFINVFHWWLYGVAGTLVDTQVEAGLVGHLTDLWNATVNSVSTTSSWLDADVEYNTSGDGSKAFLPWKTIILNLNGNEANDDLPAGVSAVVTGLTAMKGKRGRKFLPPFGEPYSNNQSWTVLGLTRLADWAAKWVLGKIVGSSAGWLYPIIVSLAGSWSPNWSIINGARANAIPGYQRRRKPGVGY